MIGTLADRYRRWFDYEKDSHARVLASLNSVPEAGRSTPAFARAMTLMAHLVAARRLWLFRFGVTSKGPSAGEFFPNDVTLPALAQGIRDVEAQWTSYLERLEDTELARTFEYESLDGGRYRNTIEDTLTQLFGHSWYHRGQIASLVRQAGGEPAVTDLVFWAREAVAAPTVKK
jgi:uncharacterized damage-inducible protein DinB